MEPIILLIIMIISFGLILGIFSRQSALKWLGLVILIAGLFPILIGIAKGLPGRVSPFLLVPIIVIGGIVGFILLLRLVLGKNLFLEVAGHFIYDLLKMIVLAPFRLISKAFRTTRE